MKLILAFTVSLALLGGCANQQTSPDTASSKPNTPPAEVTSVPPADIATQLQAAAFIKEGDRRWRRPADGTVIEVSVDNKVSAVFFSRENGVIKCTVDPANYMSELAKFEQEDRAGLLRAGCNPS